MNYWLIVIAIFGAIVVFIVFLQLKPGFFDSIFNAPRTIWLDRKGNRLNPYGPKNPKYRETNYKVLENINSARFKGPITTRPDSKEDQKIIREWNKRFAESDKIAQRYGRTPQNHKLVYNSGQFFLCDAKGNMKNIPRSDLRLNSLQAPTKTNKEHLAFMNNIELANAWNKTFKTKTPKEITEKYEMIMPGKKSIVSYHNSSLFFITNGNGKGIPITRDVLEKQLKETGKFQAPRKSKTPRVNLGVFVNGSKEQEQFNFEKKEKQLLKQEEKTNHFKAKYQKLLNNIAGFDQAKIDQAKKEYLDQKKIETKLRKEINEEFKTDLERKSESNKRSYNRKPAEVVNKSKDLNLFAFNEKNEESLFEALNYQKEKSRESYRKYEEIANDSNFNQEKVDRAYNHYLREQEQENKILNKIQALKNS